MSQCAFWEVVTIVFISLACGHVLPTLVCHTGSVEADGSSTLTNLTCTEKQTHEIATHNNDSVVYNYSLHNPEGANISFRAVEHCVAFLDSSKDMIDFMCDNHHVCENTTSHDGFTPGYQYDGSPGTLFCCSQPNCNNMDIVPKLRAQERSCYISNSSSNATVLEQCPSSHCMNRTFYTADSVPSKLVYSCDQQNYCESDQTDPNTCDNKTSPDGAKYTVCCCERPACNLAAHPPRLHMKSPGRIQHQQHSHMMMIGGIVASAMFATLVCIIIAVVIRKYKHRRQQQLSFTYAQLTADLAEPDPSDASLLSGSPRDADENMIIG